MKVATIIVTYNGASYIDRCLQSLQSPMFFDHKIIVIDNNSEDETPLLVESRFPSVTVFKSKTNLGFGQGNNVGLKMALEWGADYFFLLNQDAWFVETNGLETLVNLAGRHPEYGIVSPIHWNGNQTGFDHGFIQHISRNGESSKILFDLMTCNPKQIYPVTFVNAAAWLITRSSVEKVGGFAPLFYHYGEDDNYAHRAIYHGFKIGVSPASAIVHDRPLKEKIIMNSEVLLRIFLLHACNINKPIELVRQEYFSHYKSQVIKSIFKFKWKTALNFFDIWLQAKSKMVEIQSLRKETMNPTVKLFIEIT